MKLTAELIEQAAQYTNAVRDRELDLRGAGLRGELGPVRELGPGGRAGPGPVGLVLGPRIRFLVIWGLLEDLCRVGAG